MSSWPQPPDEPAGPRPPIPPPPPLDGGTSLPPSASPPGWPPPPPPDWGGPPQPWAGPPAYGAPYGPPPVTPTNQLGTVSMGLGISGMAVSPCCSVFGIPLGIAAVVTGIIALTQANSDPAQGGKGQAIAGLCCGAAAVVLPLLFIALQISASTFV